MEGDMVASNSPAPRLDAPERSPAAERMHQSRKRRRTGQRCITLEIHDHENDGLVSSGLLDPVARNDRAAISVALGKLMDRLPPERWPVPTKG
jgi:hypothetical protein